MKHVTSDKNYQLNQKRRKSTGRIKDIQGGQDFFYFNIKAQLLMFFLIVFVATIKIYQDFSNHTKAK